MDSVAFFLPAVVLESGEKEFTDKRSGEVIKWNEAIVRNSQDDRLVRFSVLKGLTLPIGEEVKLGIAIRIAQDLKPSLRIVSVEAVG